MPVDKADRTSLYDTAIVSVCVRLSSRVCVHVCACVFPSTRVTRFLSCTIYDTGLLPTTVRPIVVNLKDLLRGIEHTMRNLYIMEKQNRNNVRKQRYTSIPTCPRHTRFRR